MYQVHYSANGIHGIIDVVADVVAAEIWRVDVNSAELLGLSVGRLFPGNLCLLLPQSIADEAEVAVTTS